MAFRPDVWIDWAVSPRRVWVDAPSPEITIQDAVDTLRTLEAELGALDDDILIYKGEGKNFLSTDKYTGIVLTLNNTLIAFEARPGPDWVQCVVKDGDLVALDANGDPMYPIYPTAFVQVAYEKSTSPSLVYASGGSPEEIADAVWDELSAGHTDPGKAGTQMWTKLDDMKDDLIDLLDKSDIIIEVANDMLDHEENKLVLNLSTSELWLYDDTGTVVIKKWPVKNKDGGAVIIDHLGGVIREKRSL